jgi:hypothetical protein
MDVHGLGCQIGCQRTPEPQTELTTADQRNRGRAVGPQRDAVGSGERAEVLIEGAILLHDDDDVLDLPGARTGGAFGAGVAAFVDSSEAATNSDDAITSDAATDRNRRTSHASLGNLAQVTTTPHDEKHPRPSRAQRGVTMRIDVGRPG